ncbi:ferritin-like domain-containing protein [Glaciimonas immobilis]|uniref:Rubrerythrin n=1 Tax=Glaciimonas immobilis TaxID=728004 RepID=A0A840RNH4_9BURK|nr:ferritin-like domain-containing protein [Glaciimonas immobilis]KAF3999111.1 ferritin-like domain-containing protein [Glaciimonas immobilis]MBB5198546.1 rubrerythrin [Glaciimonas immobilis]
MTTDRENVSNAGSHRAPHWRIEDLDFSAIDIAKVRPDENLFYLAACASFVESGSDLYTQNLIAYYDDDPEITEWLTHYWEVEELQHGNALKTYIAHVWPEFNWQLAYNNFLAEYSGYCKVELLEPSKALEMVARCVVETGTATFYQALARSTQEPVMRDLATRIANDEVNHYKHFFSYFRRLRQKEALSRRHIFGALRRRTLEMKTEDSACALRHVFKFREPQHTHDNARMEAIHAAMNATIRQNLRAHMTIKMMMRPLELPSVVQTLVTYPATHFMNKVFLR